MCRKTFIIVLICVIVTSITSAQQITLDMVGQIAWSPDGTRLAISDYTGNIQVWGVETREQQVSLEGHTAYVTDLAWSPDGRSLASASYDQTAIVWDVETGRIIMQIEDQRDVVYAVDWSADGRHIFTGMDAVNITPWLRIWDASTGELIQEFESIVVLNTLTLEAGQKLLVSSGGFARLDSDYTLDRWFFNPLLQEDSVRACEYLWSAQIIGLETMIIGYFSGRIRVWDIQSASVIGGISLTELPDGACKEPIALKSIINLAADETTLYALNREGWLRAWDIAAVPAMSDDTPFRSVNIGLVHTAAFSPDLQFVAVSRYTDAPEVTRSVEPLFTLADGRVEVLPIRLE